MEFRAIPSYYELDQPLLTAEELALPLEKLTTEKLEAILDDCMIVDPPLKDAKEYVKVIDDAELIARVQHLEDSREKAVLPYKTEEYFRPGNEMRFCIWFDDNVGIQSSVQFKYITSGFTWICVNGKNSKCAVTWSGDMPTDSKLRVDIVLTMALLDMKEMAKPHQGGPCVLVSLAENQITGIMKAYEFLKRKLKGRSSLSDKEVVEIAVDALKDLYGGKVENCEIESMTTVMSGCGQILWSMGVKPLFDD